MTIFQFGNVALLSTYLISKFLLGKTCKATLLFQSLSQAESFCFSLKLHSLRILHWTIFCIQ